MHAFLRMLLLLGISTFLFFSSQAQWQAKSPALRKRSETTSVVYNGKLYTFLGFKDRDLNPEESSEVYDPATDAWTLLAAIPTGKAMTHQGVVLIDDNVWHIGGRVGKHPGPLTSEIWIYNITSDSWMQGPHILDPATGNPLNWGGGGAVLLGRTLHLFGGFLKSCNGDQDRFHLTLDVDSWLANPSAPAAWKNELAPMPTKRNHFGSVVLGGKIYAVGGQFGHDCGGGQDKRFVHVYDPSTDEWDELPQLPAPRSHMEGSVFAMDGQIYVISGQGTSGANTNLFTVFDPAGKGGKGAWKNLNMELPRKYEGLSAKPIDNAIYISHGGEGSSRNTRNTVFAQTVARNPLYKLGFTATCASPVVTAGETASLKTLLFLYDGTATYSTASNASWLQVDKNATGTVGASGVDIGMQVNTAGLSPGKYQAQVVATGTGSAGAYTAASYCVNLTVGASGASIVATPELVFSGVQGKKGKKGTVEIKNKGTGNLVIASLHIIGTNGDAFTLDAPPALPAIIEAGKTLNMEVQFAPPAAETGSLAAELIIVSNDDAFASLPVKLYGLSAKGEQGNREPPLADVVKTLGYKINVGGTGLLLGTQAAAIGDEILAPLFKKAGRGNVRMTPVARYSPDDLLQFGYYTSSNGQLQLHETGVVSTGQEQTLYPSVKSGGKGFDPGSSVFGLFAGSTSYAPQVTYTEDRLNTGPLAHSVRIYPLKNRAGKPVANSYLIAFEPAVNGDYQDYVFVLENAAPALRTGSGVLEAEDAFLNGAQVSTNNKGYSGSGFADFINTAGDFVEWTLDRDEAGPIVISVKYANGQPYTKMGRLEVNGQPIRSNIAFTPTGNWEHWKSYLDTITLNEGTNTIRLIAYGQVGPDVDYVTWQVLNLSTAGLLEAEAASLTGVAEEDEHSGFTGTGFADYQNAFDDFIEWVLPQEETGTVTLFFKYANGDESGRPLQLRVNGIPTEQVLAFEPTGSWKSWKYQQVTVKLQKGVNQIQLVATGASGANIDHLAWERQKSTNSIAAGRTTSRLSEALGMQLTPNPVRGMARLQVQSRSEQPLEVRVFDLSGKVQQAMVFKAVNAPVLQIPVSNLASGIYMVQVRQGTAVAVTRMVVDNR
jgi:N-acetylneuraminic acid mutarotase